MGKGDRDRDGVVLEKDTSILSYAERGKAYQRSLDTFKAGLIASGVSPEKAQALKREAIQNGSITSVPTELDVQIEVGLKAAPIVQRPNGTHYEPIGKKDSSVDIGMRVNPDLSKKVNSEFRCRWLNSENETEAENITLSNQE